MKRFWSYGLVGSFLLRGGPLIFLAYTCYILWDESEHNSVQMSPSLYK